MAIDFVLPELGENIESADVVNVLVSEGDQIQANQSVVELETDKAVVEIPCPHAGRISKVHVRKGQKVKVGQPLVAIETEADAGPAPSAPIAAQAAATPAGTATPPEASCPLAQAATAASSAAVAESLIPAGPAARRLARELGVDLRTVQGTGPRGRIRPEDVQAAAARLPSASAGGAPSAPAAAAGPSSPGPAKMPTGPELVQPWAPVVPPGSPGTDAWGPIRREPMPRIRRTIAAQMVRSASTIPHVTNFDDADITDLEALRKSIPPGFLGPEIKLTLMPFLMKAVALALRRHPALNASLDMQPDNEQLIYKEYVN
ncbi:MAG TPA: 2-oxo acid dehydrogenase subunit E2, partial [Thermoguttaceae bacterium]|nr:2-oxo acid dehydrogenase subunit E2 [Thermoguttaceae bacterium]